MFGKPEIDDEEKVKQKTAVINYDHGIGHRMLKVAEMFDVKVMFKFPHKLGRLPSSINRERSPCQEAKSTHTKYRECKKEVVYKIPMSCGKVYVG